MLKALKQSSILSVLVIAVPAVMYKHGWLLVIYVLITHLVLLLVFSQPDRSTTWLGSMLATSFAMFVLATVILPGVVASVVFGLIAIAVAALTATLAKKEDDAKEPMLALFIAYLPMFVGTVFGGILYFFRFRSCRVVATGKQ